MHRDARPLGVDEQIHVFVPLGESQRIFVDRQEEAMPSRGAPPGDEIESTSSEWARTEVSGVLISWSPAERARLLNS